MMRAFFGLLLIALYAWPGSAAADALPAADEIVAKSDAAYGKAPGNYRDTIVGTGTLGQTKSVTYHSGDDVRHVYERDGFRSEYGTFHGEDWHQNSNGLSVLDLPDPGKAAKDPLTTTVSHVTAPFDAYVVSEMNKRKAGTRSFYDSSTYLLRRVESVDASGTEVDTYDGFQSFAGRTVPTRWDETSGAYKMHYERTEYAANVVTPSDVAEPGTRRLLVEFPEGSQRVVLPATFYENQIFVRVSVGSSTGDFQIDTGASEIVVDDDFARKAGLVLRDAEVGFVANHVTEHAARVPEFRIGSLTMHDIAVRAVPMGFEPENHIKLAGLLGFDFLAQLGVTLDFEHQTVTVVPAQAYVPPDDPATYDFPVRLGDGVPMITVSVGKAVAERIICDTGWDGEFAFFDYFARRYPNVFVDDLGPGGGIGIGGVFASEYFRFKEITLGPLALHDFIGERVSESSYIDDSDGVVGNELLSHFILSLDYTHGHIYLTPTAATLRALRPN